MSYEDINNFFLALYPLLRSIMNWTTSAIHLIMDYPLLIWIFAFIMLGLVISVLGRILSET